MFAGNNYVADGCDVTDVCKVPVCVDADCDCENCVSASSHNCKCSSLKSSNSSDKLKLASSKLSSDSSSCCGLVPVLSVSLVSA